MTIFRCGRCHSGMAHSNVDTYTCNYCGKQVRLLDDPGLDECFVWSERGKKIHASEAIGGRHKKVQGASDMLEKELLGSVAQKDTKESTLEIVKMVLGLLAEHRELVKTIVDEGCEVVQEVCTAIEPYWNKLLIEHSVDFTKKKFDAYIKADFTREEALYLAAADMENLKKIMGSFKSTNKK